LTEIKRFSAFQVEETAPNEFKRRVLKRSITDLPDADVLVRVKFSSLNYKDALSATGNRGVTRSYPHIPGIDAAGVVEASSVGEYKPGDNVIITSGEMGVNQPGGFEQYVCVPAGWLIPLPRGLTLRQSMAYGTAGFTAALCVDQLMRAGVTPDRGEILVTGATGGVGSIAIGILAKEHYQVTAATGKTQNNRMLHALGASQVISRAEVDDTSGRALLHGRWAGVVDTVGGNILATAIRATQPGGVVTACGNAGGGDFSLSVYPFILRGVTLYGIDSNRPTYSERVRLWRRLARRWKLDVLDELVREVRLENLDEEIQRMLAGTNAGRVVVNLR
jgi:putative YhdH/YhfP family quinone oxidoreductase